MWLNITILKPLTDEMALELSIFHLLLMVSHYRFHNPNHQSQGCHISSHRCAWDHHIPPNESTLPIIKFPLGPGPTSSRGVAESIATCRSKLVNQHIQKTPGTFSNLRKKTRQLMSPYVCS